MLCLCILKIQISFICCATTNCKKINYISKGSCLSPDYNKSRNEIIYCKRLDGGREIFAYDLKTGKAIGAFGDTKWSIISERYEGDYNYYKTSIVEQLASNEGATGLTLNYILQNYYEIQTFDL